MQQNKPRIFIYAALPCEAKSVVDYFNLKKITTIQPFAVYVNADICLTVTGLGKTSMAAGVAYSQALLGSVDHPVLINIGIAGHKHHALGSLFLIDKITDVDSYKSHYPSMVFESPCTTASIQTSSRPQLVYDPLALCDMEASAFYETAIRFSSGELIHCLKVVSDNELSPAENILPKQVTALIIPHVATLEVLMKELGALAKLITEPELKSFGQLIRQYHFTSSEQGQLKNRLSRWEVLTQANIPEFEESQFRKGKDFLVWFDQQLDEVECFL